MREEALTLVLHRSRHWEKGNQLQLELHGHALRLKQSFRYEPGSVKSLSLPEERILLGMTGGGDHRLHLFDAEGSRLLRLDSRTFLETDGAALSGFGRGGKVRLAASGNLVAAADAKSPHRLVVYAYDERGSLWQLPEAGGEPLRPLDVAFGPQGTLHVLHLAHGRLGLLCLDAQSGQVRQAPEGEEQLLAQRPLDPDEELHVLQGRYRLLVDAQGRVCVIDLLRHLALGEPQEALMKVLAKHVQGEDDHFWMLPDGQLQIYQHKEGKLRTFVRKTVNEQIRGVWISPPLDSTEPGTVWHKIQVEADIPRETQLVIQAYASDQREFRTHAPIDLDETWESQPRTNPRDALLQGMKGRYLWLRVEWRGDEERSPVLHKLKVVFPRESYLRYLPAVYQEDEQSRDFVERFLSLFETFFDEMEDEIAEISRYFDAEAAPEEFLQWLGLWVGLATEDADLKPHLRTLIPRASELYRKRGTRDGLLDVLEIFLGERPLLIEALDTFPLLGRDEYRTLLPQLYGASPHGFCVLVPPEQALTEAQRHLLAKIVSEQKPAFTQAKIELLWPQMRLGSHLYLGVNTVLSEPQPEKRGDGRDGTPSYYVL